ncbi:MAG: hydrogenase assembly protein HypC [Ignavibacteria bacterium RBG_13_36_8]|nr:MAG: hydrogenase assembly protein HypC [Ignavibacteria bacterium RBG_13_36_8]
MCLGIPGKIIEIFEENGIQMGMVDFGGVKKNVCLQYIPEAKVGDYTIVHVGFGISILNEYEANETINYIKEIEDIDNKLNKPE